MKSVVTVVLIPLLRAGCGQKGPLYLPAKKNAQGPATEQPQAQPQTQPETPQTQSETPETQPTPPTLPPTSTP